MECQKKKKQPRTKEHRAVSSSKVSGPECLYSVHVVFLYIFFWRSKILEVYQKVMSIVYSNRKPKALTHVDLTGSVELTYLAHILETTSTEIKGECPDMNI